MTQAQQILSVMTKLGRPLTCGEIAQELPLTRVQVQNKICGLVRAGKCKVILKKSKPNINHNLANLYAIGTTHNQELPKLF